MHNKHHTSSHLLKHMWMGFVSQPAHSAPDCLILYLLNGVQANVQHVIIRQHICDAITGQQHQPVCGVQCVGVDKGLSADQGLRGLERKITQ
jgi:hypothetical protein